jgi:hemolysin III
MLKQIPIPNYKLSEEIINSISHGLGSILGFIEIYLMIKKSTTIEELISSIIFGISIIILYTTSCIYHSLPPNIKAKQIFRIIDHCTVYLLVFGTYYPISLLAVRGNIGIILLTIVSILTIIGIIITIINITKYQFISVICHLISGWSILFGINSLLNNISINGIYLLILGGISYTIGSILFGIGSKIRYIHSIFHIFCLLGTILHFLLIYLYIL